MSRYRLNEDQFAGFSNAKQKQGDNTDDNAERDKRVIEFTPSDVSGYTHAEIVDGRGVIVDGEKRDRDILIRSIKDVVKELGIGSEGRPKSERAQFLQDVCRLFRLPTTIHEDTPQNVEEVMQALDKPGAVTTTSGEPILTRKTVPQGVLHPEAAVVPAETEKNGAPNEDNDAEGTE